MEKKCLHSRRVLFQGGQVLKTRMEKKEPEEKQEMDDVYKRQVQGSVYFETIKKQCRNYHGNDSSKNKYF